MTVTTAMDLVAEAVALENDLMLDVEAVGVALAEAEEVEEVLLLIGQYWPKLKSLTRAAIHAPASALYSSK